MVCQVELPDTATRIGLVHNFAHRLEMELPDDVAEFVAERVTAGAREVSGAVKRLHAAGRMFNRPVDLHSAEESLTELFHSSRRPDSLIGYRSGRLRNLRAAVPIVCNRSIAAKMSARPACWRCGWPAELTRAGLSEIGQYFGRRSHSTVISAQKRVDDWMAQRSEVVVANSQCNVQEAVRQVMRCGLDEGLQIEKD